VAQLQVDERSDGDDQKWQEVNGTGLNPRIANGNDEQSTQKEGCPPTHAGKGVVFA
jgi:hypothetical protein